jgi:hypothetical protein
MSRLRWRITNGVHLLNVDATDKKTIAEAVARVVEKTLAVAPNNRSMVLFRWDSVCSRLRVLFTDDDAANEADESLQLWCRGWDAQGKLGDARFRQIRQCLETSLLANDDVVSRLGASFALTPETGPLRKAPIMLVRGERRTKTAPKKSKQQAALWIWSRYEAGTGFRFALKQRGLTYEQSWQLLVGEPLKGKPTLHVGALTHGQMPDCLGTNASCLVVSQLLRDVLDASGCARLQYVPVKLAGVRSSYWALNVLDAMPCVDRERSKLTWDAERPDRVDTVSKLVVSLPTSDSQIFHVAEMRHLVVVTDALKEKLQTASSSAGCFDDLAKYKSD